VSYSTVLLLFDDIGSSFDSKVKEWTKHLQATIPDTVNLSLICDVIISIIHTQVSTMSLPLMRGVDNSEFESDGTVTESDDDDDDIDAVVVGEGKQRKLLYNIKNQVNYLLYI
jgi:hypothetical protein